MTGQWNKRLILQNKQSHSTIAGREGLSVCDRSDIMFKCVYFSGQKTFVLLVCETVALRISLAHESTANLGLSEYGRFIHGAPPFYITMHFINLHSLHNYKNHLLKGA